MENEALARMREDPKGVALESLKGLATDIEADLGAPDTVRDKWIDSFNNKISMATTIVSILAMSGHAKGDDINIENKSLMDLGFAISQRASAGGDDATVEEKKTLLAHVNKLIELIG